MGYRKEPKVYKLIFEDYDGLEVSVRSLSVKEFMRVAKLTSNDNAADQVDGLGELTKAFAASLESWNLEDENGNPYPVEAINDLDNDFVMELVTEWMTAIAGVNPNLEKNLNSSETLGQLPMATL